MSDFSVLELSNNVLIIILNTSQRVDEHINGINQALNAKHFKGIIYFDLLLSNGLNSRRFFKSDYVGDYSNFLAIKRINEIPKEIVEKSNQYFSFHKELLDKGILTASAKRQILDYF